MAKASTLHRQSLTPPEFHILLALCERESMVTRRSACAETERMLMLIRAAYEKGLLTEPRIFG